jgi:hypothetical protein
MNEAEIILQVGAEGGSHSVYGTRTADGWRFHTRLVDQTPLLLDEEPIEVESPRVAELQVALAQLARGKWRRFIPLKVHPEFRTAIWEAVNQRAEELSLRESLLEEWRLLCLDQ